METSGLKPHLIISYNNLFVRIFLQGLLPILPVLAIAVGATKMQVGIVLSSMFSTMLLGTLAAGKIASHHVNFKTLIIGISLLLALSIAFLGSTNSFPMLLMACIIIGLCDGLYIMSFFIYLGKISKDSSVSKNFSIITFTNQIATVAGGLLLGFFISHIGQRNSFFLFGVAMFISSLSVMLLPELNITNKTVSVKFHFQRKYVLLLLVSFLTIMCIHIFNLTFSMILLSNKVPAYKISYYSAIGTGLMAWFPILLGNKTTSKTANFSFLICSVSIIIAFLVLRFSTNPYLYVASVAIMSIMTYPFFIPVMQKIFVWHTREEMPMAQSYYSSVAWLAAIVGYLISGSVLQYLSPNVNIAVAIVFACIAIAIISTFNREENQTSK